MPANSALALLAHRQGNMAENTITGTPNATLSDKEIIANYLKEHSVEHPSASASATGTVPADFQPVTGQEKPVAPMDFVAIHSDMERFDVRTIVMTYRQVADYVGFAHELYTPEVDAATGKKVVPLEQKWQRKLDSKRVREAMEYLLTENHYFPAIVCVPATAESCVFSNGSVTIHKDGILALDGQHRVAAIQDAVKDLIARNPKIADECVTIQILYILDQKTRRQVFADINRTPRKVPRALNLVFDNVDRVARISKEIIDYVEYTNADGSLSDTPTEYAKHPLQQLFDMERPTPTAKSVACMSLTNLYDMLGPIAKLTEVVKDEEGNDQNAYVLSDVQLRQTVQAIVYNYPDVDKLVQGRTTFGEMKKEFITTSATIHKALGKLLAERLNAKNEAGERKYQPDEFPNVVAGWVDKVKRDGNWRLSSKIWRDPNREVVLATKGNRVGTQKGDIDNAVSVLRDQMN